MTSTSLSRFDLAGKVALVTGASGGLGAHFAGVLSEAGASVAITARREEKLAALASELNDKGGKALAISLDIAGGKGFQDCFDRIEESLGPVDILVNNAGISGDGGFWRDISDETWNKVMDTNLNGLWSMCQEMCQRLESSSRPGTIINISSIYGHREGLLKLPYNVSKAAVMQLTKTLAAELLQQKLPIRVNALCPGYFDTDINAPITGSDQGRRYLAGTPAGRMGRFEELDGALLLLASEAGSFINGTSLVVDGGHLVKPI